MTNSAKYQGFSIVIGTTQTPSERLYIAFQKLQPFP